MDIDIFKSWIEVCKYIKNSGLKYRVPMNDVYEHHKVFRQKYNKPIGLFAIICK
jgi:hypothetical protein